MQVLLNCHLAAFLEFEWTVQNNDQMIACVVALASYIDIAWRKAVSTWLQLDISPCSYQSYSVLTLILHCLAVPFLQSQAVLFSISHNFDNITIQYL